jgi:hypothetical protein
MDYSVLQSVIQAHWTVTLLLIGGLSQSFWADKIIEVKSIYPAVLVHTVIPALRRLRQEDWEFKASQGYIARLPQQSKSFFFFFFF